MMTIGQRSYVYVRQRMIGIGKYATVRDAEGNPVKKLKEDHVWRQTQAELGDKYGVDKHRRLIVGLVAPDLLVMYPKGTRHRVTVELKQVYYDAICRLAVSRQLEKARSRKAQLEQQRRQRRLDAMERRLKKKP